MTTGPRLCIAAFHMSLDGYMQGTDGAVDWVDSWSDALDLIPGADAAVLGGGMYPGYEQLWGSVAADPESGTAMLGRPVTEGEAEYAQWTQRTPHYVVSTTLAQVNWPTAHIVRDVSELGPVKNQPGGPIYVVGGPALVASLLNQGLIDELRLIIHPVILGGGKTPFTGVTDRTSLGLIQSRTARSGRVVLTYRVDK